MVSSLAVIAISLLVAFAPSVYFLWRLESTPAVTNLYVQGFGALKSSDLSKAVSSSPHAMCIIVPFRGAWKELQEFAPRMGQFLSAQNVSFTIFIANQVDPHPFNRGALLNAGFIHSGKTTQCDYVALHDVDLLPLNKDILYAYPEKGPMHLIPKYLHPKYFKNRVYYGGIVLMTRSHYRQINGFSNVFWGWGHEDEDYADRVFKAGLAFSAPKGIKTDRRNTFLHIHVEGDRPRDRHLYSLTSIGSGNSTGVSTLAFRVTNHSVIDVGGQPVHQVDVWLERKQ